jgi:dTDP-L-rhamnose 4-epimerase
VDALVSGGTRVRVLDALLDQAHSDRPDYLNPGAEYVFGDLRDVDLVARALDGVEAVSHQASMVGLGTDLGDVADYVGHNDAGTASLLLAMHRRRFAGRVVLGSSMVVYGEGSYKCREHGEVRPPPRDPLRLSAGAFEPSCPVCGADLEPEPVREDTAADPRNVYAATKLHQEHLCAVFARERSAALVILRYHNVYGPRMPKDTPYAGVAAIFRSSIEAGRPPQVYEDGRQLRDFVHVSDIARANVLALSDDAPPGTYNVASGVPRTVGDMAWELVKAAGDGAPPPLVTAAFRLGDVRHVFASIDRARHEIGYRPSVSFDDGMREFATAPLRSASRS